MHNMTHMHLFDDVVAPRQNTHSIELSYVCGLSIQKCRACCAHPMVLEVNVIPSLAYTLFLYLKNDRQIDYY